MIGSIIIKYNPVTLHERYLLNAAPANHIGVTEAVFANYSPEKRAEGGYWTCKFEFFSRENILKEMFENGLGRHVEVWGHGLQQDFEGFIHEMIYHLPPDSYTVSLEKVVNKAWMRADLDGDGDVDRSTVLHDMDSQTRFGIKEDYLTANEVEGTIIADQAVQTFLNLRAWFKPEAQLGRARGEERLEIVCRGYIHTLNWRIYNQTDFTGTQALSQQIKDIVGSVMEIPSSLLTSLIAWWSLDQQSGTRLDKHTNSLHLTDNNTVLTLPGKQDFAADFEAVNSEHLSHADDALLSFADEDFTLSCWVKFESLGVQRTIMGKYDATDNQREYILFYSASTSRISLAISNNGTGDTTLDADTLGVPSVGVWYFITVWHDSTANTMNIQVNNGVVDSAAYTLGCNDNASVFSIGAQETAGSFTNFMDGIIDEAAIWNKVLSATERNALYNNGMGIRYEWIGETELIPNLGQFVESADIDGNGTTVTKEYDRDDRALALIESLTALGDGNNNRWLAYMTQGRRFVLRQAVPSMIP